MSGSNIHFGVNYIPSYNWLYSWADLDLTKVEEDIAAIADLGFDHIRMHMRWDLVQPNSRFIVGKYIRHLSDILDICQKYRLRAEVTALNGWMSGFWFIPAFLWNKHIIKDKSALEAEKFYLQSIADAVALHPALMGIDIGNEINVYASHIRKFSVRAGDAWLKEILGFAGEKFPGKINVVGVDHQPWFADTQFSRKALANTGSVTSLHSWVAFTGAARFGARSEECFSLAEFMAEMANAYAEDLSRKVWIQEFGITEPWIPEADFPLFVDQTIKRALRADNIWGFTWWCSHDIDRKFGDFAEIEYDLGLLTSGNKVKPLGEMLRSTIRSVKKGECAPRLQNDVAVVVDEQKAFDGWKYGKKFADLLRQGVHAKFVLSSKEKDARYLAARNIREIL